MLKVFVGYDSRFVTAYQVCARSLISRSAWPVDIVPLVLPHLQACGLYTRPTVRSDAGLIDLRSNAPMSTEFALSRFLVPRLTGFRGWAVYCDSDFLYRADIAELFQLFDPRFAVMVVKHDHQPVSARKMDGQVQTNYPRKNWSSLIAWNCAHPAHRGLTPGLFKQLTGLQLHGFSWLADEQIGDLPLEWNWLEGHSPKDMKPKAVHYTRGTPDLFGFEDAAFAVEWNACLSTVIAQHVERQCR